MSISWSIRPAAQQAGQGKLRQSIVEPVFGSLVQHYGLRRINVLGKSGAHKAMVLAAVAFNLRKYMKFKPTKCKCP
jgi:murein DD-endopeptidase MepM/ murein hydrolase activator NlpD